MKILFVRSGGFAGLRLSTSIDTAVLDPEKAAQIGKLVDAAGFFAIPGRTAIGPANPDAFEYRVEISAESLGTHSVSIAESAVPDRLRPLLEYLTALALVRLKPDGQEGVQ